MWRGESTFPFGMQSTDWPLFCTEPCASRIPRRAERLGSLLDAASGEFRPQPHTTCTLSRRSSILKRRPLVLLPCQRLPAQPGSSPCSPVGREAPFLTGCPQWGKEAFPGLLEGDCPPNPAAAGCKVSSLGHFAHMVKLPERIRAQSCSQPRLQWGIHGFLGQGRI